MITKNSVDGTLSYSGQFKAFMHVARFMQKGAKILRFAMQETQHSYSSYDKKQENLCATVFENPDGTRVYVSVNSDEEKKQVQFAEDGQLYYVELLPDSVSTIVVEKS